MQIDIITNQLELNLYGFSGIAVNRDYVGTAFKLMDKMWQVVKGQNLKNKGMNIWVYEPGERVFAGVELDEVPEKNTGLEHKLLTMNKYAYYKHIGPYSGIKEAGINMGDELKREGYQMGDQYIEIYGHWTNDESKLETELFMSLK